MTDPAPNHVANARPSPQLFAMAPNGELTPVERYAAPVQLPPAPRPNLLLRVLAAIRSPFHAAAMLKATLFAGLAGIMIAGKFQWDAAGIVIAIADPAGGQILIVAGVATLMVAGNLIALMLDRARKARELRRLLDDITDVALADHMRAQAAAQLLER